MYAHSIASLALAIAICATTHPRDTVATATCRPEPFLWIYPPLAACLFFIASVADAHRRAPTYSMLGRILATALLVAPFTHAIIQQCHLAIITYVTIEFCIIILADAVVSKTDIATVAAVYCLKLYIYVSYTLIDTRLDNHKGITLYLIFDAIAAGIRTLLMIVHTSPSLGIETYKTICTQLNFAAFILQAIVAQSISNHV